MENKKIDESWYDKELSKEQENDLWTAEDDSTERITLLGEPYMAQANDGRDIAVFPIEVGGGERRTWILNRKYSEKAPFMQVCRAIKKAGGIPKDVGLVLTVIIIGQGRTRQYTIIDSNTV